MQAQEVCQKKKIDMPIKKLPLRIWLSSVPTPTLNDTLSKENTDFFSLACI